MEHLDGVERQGFQVRAHERQLGQDVVGDGDNVAAGRVGLEDVKELAQNIAQAEDSLVEIDRQGSTIIQKGFIRIIITRPPFSDGWEITAVKPIKLMELKEYSISANLLKRIKEQAEGILIAGPPGQGGRGRGDRPADAAHDRRGAAARGPRASTRGGRDHPDRGL